MAKAGQPRQALAAEAFQVTHRLGPLQGQQHTIALGVGDLDALGFQLLADPGGVGLGAGGVDYQ